MNPLSVLDDAISDAAEDGNPIVDALREARAVLLNVIEEALAVCELPDPMDTHTRLRAALAACRGAA